MLVILIFANQNILLFLLSLKLKCNSIPMKNKLLLSLLGASVFVACTSKKNDVELASINTDFISETVKPSEDFFQFANENWLKNNPVPPSESRWGSFNELRDENNKKLTEILENLKNSDADKGTKEQLLGDFYASFLDMKTRNKKGISPIQADLDAIKNLQSIEALPNLVGELHKYGVGGFFGFGVGQDLKNVDYHIMHFGQGGIGLPNCTYYTDTAKADIQKAYKKFMADAFKLAKYDQVDIRVSNVFQIENKLASEMMIPEKMRIPELTYNKMAYADLKNTLSNFNMDEYVKAIDASSFDTLVVNNTKFPAIVNDLIATQSLDAIKDYLTWKTLHHYMGDLNQEFVELNFAFHGTTLSGKKEMKPANERAITAITHNSIGEMLGHAFVDKYFSKEAKERVNKMVDNLEAAFKERIENLTWMSAETKKQAMYKLSSFGRKLGFPDKWEDFSSLDFKANTYVDNIKNLALYDHVDNMKELNEKVDKEEWGMPAHMVNAYYHPLLNEIAFPAGIMQPPFFDNNAEDALNYGRIGMVIGHEFTHGFDDMGSKFAADGSFENWWTEEDRKAFEAKTTVYGETFSKFCPFDGICVNPKLTMGENIADLGGLTMAYYAYTRTDEFKKGEVKHGYTPAQRFFISYAQLWKINFTDEELKKRIATDPHSPGMYRVNGPLKNCPEFFEAFNIKEGAAMRNPKDKVAVIW